MVIDVVGVLCKCDIMRIVFMHVYAKNMRARIFFAIQLKLDAICLTLVMFA